MNLNLMAPVNQLGYGVAGLNTLKALQSQGLNVSFFPIGQPQVVTQEDAEAVKRGMEAAKLFDVNAPCVRMWHQHDMAQFVGRGKHIGFPIFELDTFNELEKHHLNSCDELMVCSQWANGKGLRLSLFPVRNSPFGVDMNIKAPGLKNVLLWGTRNNEFIKGTRYNSKPLPRNKR